MEKEIITKVENLLFQTKVMTFSVYDGNIPWSSPVYFVYYDQQFFFFSNNSSKHIQHSKQAKLVAASIFHDDDDINSIFGFQMTGRVERVDNKGLKIKIIKKYGEKFKFLTKKFGKQVLENPNFFLEKFKSELFGFYPVDIFLSDSSRVEGKRSPIYLEQFEKARD